MTLSIFYPITALTSEFIRSFRSEWGLIYSKAGVLLITQIHSELHQCFCNRDSKDEAQKSQAEKDLEEIKKIVEESGGKLSNRRLKCEV